MTLTRRERIVIVLTAIVLSILALDRFVLTPLLEKYWAVGAEKQRLLGEMQRAERLLSSRRQVDSKWRHMLASGLRHNPAEAENQMMHALRDWSEDAGLRLSSLKPQRPTADADLQEITFDVTGQGAMGSISRFLWRLTTTTIPIKLKAVELRSRKEGIDDLTVQLQLSTLYLAGRAPLSSKASIQTEPTGDSQ